MSDEITVEVIGAGVAGEATGKALNKFGNNVIFKDVDNDTLDRLSSEGFEVSSVHEYVEADASVICVPTPYNEDKDKLESKYVFSAVGKLDELDSTQDRSVIIHSTIVPGTTKEIADQFDLTKIAAMPEFLKARQAFEDAVNQENVICGTNDGETLDLVKQMYPDKSVHSVNPEEASLVKLMSNSYVATTISFANEFWRVGNNMEGIDSDTVSEKFIEVSPWIENSGSGEDGLIGGWPYGGACIPKDTSGTFNHFEDIGEEAPQLSGTIQENQLMKELSDTKEPEV